jgi:small subunit ribosomal protein S20
LRRQNVKRLTKPSQNGVPLDLACSGLYVSPLSFRTAVPSITIVEPRLLCRESSPPRSACAKRTAQNRTQRSKLRTAIKKVRSATGKDIATAYAEAVELLDRSGRKRQIHPNAAARQKSRLAKLLKGSEK